MPRAGPDGARSFGEEVPKDLLRMKRPCCAGESGDRPARGGQWNGPEPVGVNAVPHARRVARPFAEKVVPEEYAASKGLGLASPRLM